MSGINNFDVLKKMSADNMDIRMGTDVVRMNKVKAGSQVTMGIAGDVVTPVFLGDLRAVLLVFNKQQFDETRAKLESEIQICANCGKPYGEHLLHDGNKCSLGSVTGWFPKQIADAITKVTKSAGRTTVLDATKMTRPGDEPLA